MNTAQQAKAEQSQQEWNALTAELQHLSYKLKPLRQQVAELDELFMATWRRRELLERKLTPVKQLGPRREATRKEGAVSPADFAKLIGSMTAEQKAQLIAALKGGE